MHCTHCGTRLEDGVSFCTQCGAPIGQAAPAPQVAPAQQASADPALPTAAQQPAAAPQQQPPARQRSRLVIPAAIAIAVVILAIVLAVVFLVPKSDEGQEAASTSASSSQSEAAAPTFESDLFRITLPEDVASKVSFTERHNSVMVTYTPTNAFIAEILPKGEAVENEAKHSNYSLGEVYVSGHYEEAVMALNFVDSSDKPVHWSSDAPVELGITKLLGMSPEQFAACIELGTGSSFVPATATPLGEDASGSQPSNNASGAASASAVPASAFWGIWAQASKDKAEMDAAAQRMKDDYGLDAFVVLSTDWSNLNSEPWYCVSLGSYPSQDAADAALPTARAAYSDAYVKYSGDRK